MIRRRTVKIALGALVLGIVVIGFALQAAAATKVTLCHKPTRSTLSVNSNSVPSHLAHGDSLGACSGSPSS